MKISFAWIGHKKDNNGKSHLWGLLDKDEEHTNIRYIFWCSIGKKIKVNLQREDDPFSSYVKKIQKDDQGYKHITQEKVVNRWPQVMDDIEMQFVIERFSV